ncbi:unnamed protein product [Caenorhabditis brenneri]
MSSPRSSTSFSNKVTIANPDQWIHGHDTKMPMGSKRCHLRPALQYAITGLINNASYHVQLKIERVKKLKLKYLAGKNRYWKHSHDHEETTVQFVDLPGVPENSWNRGSDLKLLDFSKGDHGIFGENVLASASGKTANIRPNDSDVLQKDTNHHSRPPDTLFAQTLRRPKGQETTNSSKLSERLEPDGLEDSLDEHEVGLVAF